MEETVALPESPPEIHTRGQALIFRGKALLLQLKRALENLFNPKIRRFSANTEPVERRIIAESKTPLWTEGNAAEQFLVAGKVQNLRLAARCINGVEIPAGEIFSFWAQIGRATRLKGYVAGRELREGCLIPTVGGGLCQLSNALYDAALKANFEIVERRAHTRVVAGSLAESGRDATVFWNYVDLRFKSPDAFRIEAGLDKDYLTVKFKAGGKNTVQVTRAAKNNSINSPAQTQNPKSCASCGVESCFRSLKPPEKQEFGRAAVLLDEFSPEFDDYVQKARKERDFLFIPLNGKRFRKANYAWKTEGFSKVEQRVFVTLRRAYQSRKLAAQGAARQASLLETYEKLAESYARSIPFDALHLFVQQNLLPFLWQSGALGGRTFDVLMTALPMADLQERLDQAARLHPESKTLDDFRADGGLVEAETRALQNARRIVTPHAKIASLFGEKAELLAWKLPAAQSFEKKKNEKFTVVFPASTVGRKGCYELREALRGLDVRLVTLGAQIEGTDFWRGIDAAHNDSNWLEKADSVVLPAFVEHKPRRILQAVANRIPVVVSNACGVENLDGVTSIEAGDGKALRLEIERIIG